MHFTKRRNDAGFTLVELLVVTAMMSVVALAIYATFANGIKIWQRINQDIPEEELNIFFDKFSSDIRNSIKFSTISFLGQDNTARFATLVNSSHLQRRTVGEVVYLYDPQAETLTREQLDYADVYLHGNGETNQSLKHIRSLNFSYYFYDPETKKYLWSDETKKSELPLAVKIELDIGNDKKTSHYSKTVSLPTAS